MKSLTDFGQKIAKVQDACLSDVDHLGEVRKRIASRVLRPKRHRRRLWVAAIAAAAGIMAMAAVMLILRPQPLSLKVGDGKKNVLPGEWIAAARDAEVPIRFSDGSIIRLKPGSGARVADIDASGARILLERGRANVSVVPRNNSTWKLKVGPFDVRVKGTIFELSWVPFSKAFSLHLIEGSVVVRGPMIQDGRELKAGQVLRAWVEEQRVEISIYEQEEKLVAKSEAASSTETPVKERAIKTPPYRREKQPIMRSKLPKSPMPTPEADSWQVLIHEGRYRKALDIVENIGFGNVLEHASATDLLALGDAARLAWQGNRAEQTYRTIRKRFPRSNSASTAAFTLSRIAFDQKHVYPEAVQWLETYLKEQQNGGLVREALGRLIEAHRLTGNRNKALDVARRYLKQYPSGPHAPFAKNVVEEDIDSNSRL